MKALLALVPIGLILLLMIKFHWPASRSGSLGYISAMLIAAIFFGAGPELLGYAHLRAVFLSLDVLMIIWAAFILYQVANQAGAIKILGEVLPQLTPDRGMQALIIGWGFTSFLQGVGGFGVPVAVTAPILIGLGFSPALGVVIPSIGHGWAVTFGSLASSFQALIASTGLAGETLAPLSALFLGITGIISGYMILHVSEGTQAIRRLFLPTLIIGSVMAFLQYVMATSGLWNIAAFIGGLGGILVAIPLAKITTPQKDFLANFSAKRLLQALTCYIILVAIILLIQFVTPVKQFLGQIVLQANFPEVSTTAGYITPAGPSRKISIFTHAGTILLYASTISFLIYRKFGMYNPGASKLILKTTVKKMMSSSVSITSMICMATIMQNSGMTDSLARGMASLFGIVYPLAAPWIGAIGSFITGSNTNANVMLGALQLRTAQLLGYKTPLILAAQTAGAALASVISPTKIVVGVSTAGMSGEEGTVMKKTIPYIAVLIFLLSLITFIGTLF